VDAELQRDHYKSEWHRYNLKRKVVGLTPLLQEDFAKIESQHKQKLEEDGIAVAVADLYCQSCRKPFANENAWTNHQQSKKHLDLVKKNENRPPRTPKSSETEAVKPVVEDEVMEDAVEEMIEDDGDSDWESVDGDEILSGDKAIDITSCLFCQKDNGTLEANVLHMTKEHSFFIPDAEYLQDLEGLVEYLGEKVGVGLRCLWCCDTGKRFKTLLSVQQHMVTKGHCKMRLEAGETLLEYVDFYDYSPSYPDGSTAEKDSEVELKELVVDEDMQLVLPSGATVGHRSLAKYYRQNLRETPLSSRPDTKKRAVLHDLLSQYRALGWTSGGAKGMDQIQKKTSDLRFLAKQRLKVGMTNNKVGQMFFRNQTLAF
jgi:pre-60S factor REI1